jgi:hypothetical protein
MCSLIRILRYAITVLTILLIVAIGAYLFVSQDTVVPPHIEQQPANITLPAPTYSFPFRNVTVSFTTPVDSAVYFGAKAANKETIIRGNISDEIWIEKTYLSMIRDPAQDVFYSQLINTLRSVRSQQNLSDDEYVELAAVFIQSIPYETTHTNPPKFPVETFVDRSGDCDDKSLLLAGLLSQEGYNVSLLSFRPESHMAVGVVCPGGEYKQTGYSFIETTNLSFIGVPTGTLSEGLEIHSDPLVIRIGDGTKTYGSCTESLYLDSVYDLSEQKVEELTTQIDNLKAEMDRYYENRDAKNYNSRVPIFNSLQRKRMQYAELHNYILGHLYDRKGTYAYVKANLPE